MHSLYYATNGGMIALANPATADNLHTYIPFSTILITGLAYDATTDTWFGVTSNLSPTWAKSLVTIDIAHGIFALRGLLNIAGGTKPVSDISINAAGQIYGVVAGNNSQLCSINKLTGAATLIGSATTNWGGGCAFLGSVFYWLPQGGPLLTVNLTTGATTTIAAVSPGTFPNGIPSSMAYDSDAGLFVYARAFGYDFYSIDPATGATVLLAGDPTSDEIDAVAYGPIIPYARPFLPAPSIDVDNGWFVDFLNHDLTVQQSFNPENLHFVRRISAVEDFDCTISRSARNTDGGHVISRVLLTDEDIVKPYANMFRLRRMVEGVEFKVMAGLITNTNMALGRDNIRISGKDWLHYLDRRQIPFTSSDPLAFRFGTTVTDTQPPTGFAYQEIARDVALIVKDILDIVLTQSYSLPIDYSGLAAIGQAINFSIGLGDTSTALSLIDGIAQYWPGFDYRISYDRVFNIWAPTRFGDPDDTADGGATGPNISLLVGSTFGLRPVSLELTQGGILSSHLRGEGAGTQKQTQISRSLGASDIQGAFWRLDGSESFGDQAKTQDIVDKRTRQQFIFGAQEQHDIECTVDTSVYTPNIFWNTVHPGLALWLSENLYLHGLESAQRIMEMDCTVNNQGDERVKFGLNQIYNTSSHYGVDQG